MRPSATAAATPRQTSIVVPWNQTILGVDIFGQDTANVIVRPLMAVVTRILFLLCKAISGVVSFEFLVMSKPSPTQNSQLKTHNGRTAQPPPQSGISRAQSLPSLNCSGGL